MTAQPSLLDAIPTAPTTELDLLRRIASLAFAVTQRAWAEQFAASKGNTIDTLNGRESDEMTLRLNQKRNALDVAVREYFA